MVCNNYPKVGCSGGKAVKQVTIEYNECEMDKLYLCSTCADFVVKDANKHGYKVNSQNLVFAKRR